MIEPSSSPKSTPKQIKNTKPKPKVVKSTKFSWRWPLTILFITITLSLVFSISSELILSKEGIVISLIIIFVLLFISVMFDMLGVAVAGASIEPFLAMSSRRIHGAKQAIKLVKNAEKVASFSSDVIGDMCGILSGAVGASIAIQIYDITGDMKTVVIAAAISSVIAGLTVFGKALGKKYAINHPETIVLFVSKIISFITFDKR